MAHTQIIICKLRVNTGQFVPESQQAQIPLYWWSTTQISLYPHTCLSRKQCTGAHMYTVAISILPQLLHVCMYIHVYTCKCPPHTQHSSHYIRFTVPSTNTYMYISSSLFLTETPTSHYLSSLFTSPNTYIIHYPFRLMLVSSS